MAATTQPALRRSSIASLGSTGVFLQIAQNILAVAWLVVLFTNNTANSSCKNFRLAERVMYSSLNCVPVT